MTEQKWLTADDLTAMLWFLVGRESAAPSRRRARMFAVACCRRVWHLLDPRSRRCLDDFEATAGGTPPVGLQAAAEEVVDEWTASHASRLLSSGDDMARWKADVAVRSAVGDQGWGGGDFVLGHVGRALMHEVGRDPDLPDDDDLWPSPSGSTPCGWACNRLRDIVGNPFGEVLTEWQAQQAVAGRYVCEKCGERIAEPSLGIFCTACRVDFVRKVRRRELPGVTVFADAWRTPQVVALAHAAYDDRRDDGTLHGDRLAVLSDALEDVGCDSGAVLGHLRQGVGTPMGLLADGTLVTRHAGRLSAAWPHVRGCWALDLILDGSKTR